MNTSDRNSARELSIRSGLDTNVVTSALDGDLASLNDLGYNLKARGFIGEGLGYLQQSARGGFPWALATFSWTKLFTTQFQQARDLFDDCESACIDFVEECEFDADFGFLAAFQWINAQSNDALCRLALGDNFEHALEIWEAGKEFQHPESQFFPALVAWKQDDPERAAAIIQGLSPQVLHEMRGTLREGAKGAQGWFSEWCRSGQGMLREVTKKREVSLESLGIVGDFSSLTKAPSRANACVHCGSRLISGNKFCIECGERL